MSVCKTGCTDLSLPENKPKATPLVSQAGGKGGPVIQGFALSKSIIPTESTRRIAVCPGVIYSPIDEVKVSYSGSEGSFMSLVPGERLVVPLGKYELFFSSDVEIRYASSGFSVFEIPPMVLISDISTQSEGFVDDYGRVVLIGTQVISDLSFIVTGHKVSYQWYYAEGLSALPVPIVGQCSSNLDGGSELKSGVYRCVASTPYDSDIVSSWINIFADPSVYELFPINMAGNNYGYSAGYGSMTPSVVPIYSPVTNVYSEIKDFYIDSESKTMFFTIVDGLEFYADDGQYGYSEVFRA